jgi:hypothetical protein
VGPAQLKFKFKLKTVSILIQSKRYLPMLEKIGQKYRAAGIEMLNNFHYRRFISNSTDLKLEYFFQKLNLKELYT